MASMACRNSWIGFEFVMLLETFDTQKYMCNLWFGDTEMNELQNWKQIGERSFMVDETTHWWKHTLSKIRAKSLLAVRLPLNGWCFAETCEGYFSLTHEIWFIPIALFLFAHRTFLSFIAVWQVKCSVKIGSPWVWDDEWQDMACSFRYNKKQYQTKIRWG
jgi:hypothetical protein